MTKLDTSGKQVKIIYLGIGSNLGNKKDNIEKAKSLLIENNINLMNVINEIKDANIEDGGSGAFYIFLKKNRSTR